MADLLTKLGNLTPATQTTAHDGEPARIFDRALATTLTAHDDPFFRVKSSIDVEVELPRLRDLFGT